MEVVVRLGRAGSLAAKVILLAERLVVEALLLGLLRAGEVTVVRVELLKTKVNIKVLVRRASVTYRLVVARIHDSD